MASEPKGVRVFELVFTDGKIDISLDYVQRQYLMYLASRSGESTLDYATAGLSESQRKVIQDLDKVYRCISETKVIGYTWLYHHRLTDIGRNIVQAIIDSGETMDDVEKAVAKGKPV